MRQPSISSTSLRGEASQQSTSTTLSVDTHLHVEKASASVLPDCIDKTNSKPSVADALVLSIALHHSPHVQTLNMANCMASADHCTALGKGLTHVKELNMLGNTGLHGGGLQALTNSLTQCSAVQLENLKIQNCTLDEDDCDAISQLLHRVPSLRQLSLALNYLGPRGISRLQESMTKSKLELLNLQKNELNSEAGSSLGMVVRNSQHLQFLSVADNILGNDGVRELLSGVPCSRRLQVLDLSRTGVDDGVLDAVSTCLSLRSTTLQTAPGLLAQHLVIRLHGNTISRGGLEEVARRFPASCQDCVECDSMEVKGGAVEDQDYEEFFKDYVRQGGEGDLVMCQQGIGDSGAEQIARLLQNDRNVHALNLSWNSIGDVGAAALGAALQVNTTLHGLSLDLNRLGCAGVVSMVTSLMTSHKTLKFINLACNPVFSDSTDADMRRSAREAVQRLVGASTGLRFLDLYVTGFGDTECKAIGEAVTSDGCALSFLRLGGNAIGDEGVDFLCSGLEQNSTIQYLDLSTNKISNGGVERIRRCVEVRSQQGRLPLRRIWLGKNRVDADTLTDCMVNGQFAYPSPPDTYTKVIKMYC